MATPGQGIGAAIGFGLGWLVGNPMLGMAIGGTIGLWLDPLPAPDPPPLGDLGINTYTRNSPIPVCFGEVKAYGGLIWIGHNSVYMENVGSSKEPQYMVRYELEFAVAFSEGPIHSVIAHKINEQTIDELEPGDAIDLSFDDQLGTSNQIVVIPDHEIAYRNTAYSYIEGSIGRQNKVPVISFDIYGLLSEGSTKPDPTPIEVLYEWLTNSTWGFGIDPEYIDGTPTNLDTTWGIENDYCHEIVDDGFGGVEPRFTFADTYTGRTKGYDIISGILQTCRGLLYLKDGNKLCIKIEKPDEVPVLYFAENHEEDFISTSGTSTTIGADFSNYPENYWKGDEIIFTYNGGRFIGIVTSQDTNSIEVFSANPDIEVPSIGSGVPFTLIKSNMEKGSFTYNKRGVREIHNRVRLEFVNKEDLHRWDIVEDEDMFNMEDTREIREQTIRMSGIRRKSQAARTNAFLLDYQSYVEYLCEFKTDILGYLLSFGDVIGVTYAPANFEAKKFRISGIEEGDNYTTKLSLVEYVSEVYHDMAKPIIATQDYNQITNPYLKPSQVRRLHVVQDTTQSKIFILFSDPEFNAEYYSGGLTYVQKGLGEAWTYVGLFPSTSSVEMTSVLTDSALDLTNISINEDSLIGDILNGAQYIVIGNEILSVSYDSGLGVFTITERGYNSTPVEAHTTSDYIYMITLNNSPSITYTSLEVGIEFYFKVIANTTFDIRSSSATAPTTSLSLV
jgi:hypothetical protein